MSRIGKEGAGIRQHTDEIAKAAQIGQGIHLLSHAVLRVIKPPAAAVLNLTDPLTGLKAAHDGINNGIIVWI